MLGASYASPFFKGFIMRNRYFTDEAFWLMVSIYLIIGSPLIYAIVCEFL